MYVEEEEETTLISNGKLYKCKDAIFLGLES